MKFVSMMIAVAGAASAANAGVILDTSNAAYSHLQSFSAFAIGEGSGSGNSTTVVTAGYDNWTSPATGVTSLFPTAGLPGGGAGGDEIADDLTLAGAAPGVGRVSTIGWNIANPTAAGSGTNILTATMVIRLYTSTGALILTNQGFGGFSFNVGFGAGLGPQVSTRIQSNDLGNNSWFIPGATGVFMSIQTAAMTGTGGLAAVGYQTRGPIIIGSSTDSLIDVTTSTAFNFGGNPLANTGLYLNTDNVPAPASFALLGLGGLIAARRRRA